MKKILLLLVTPFLFVKQSIALEKEITTNQIWGKWQCEIRYPDLQIRTIDKLELLKNGTVFGLGYIFVRNEFAYETAYSGVWAFKHNQLAQVAEYNIIPIHPDFTMKKLKTDKNYAALEQNISQSLKEGFESYEPIQFKINKIEGDELTFEQKLANKRYAGVCLR